MPGKTDQSNQKKSDAITKPKNRLKKKKQNETLITGQGITVTL